MKPTTGLVIIVAALIGAGCAHIEQPSAAAVACNQGMAKLAQGDFDGAIAEFDRAIVLDPANAEAFRERGAAKDAKGDFDGAAADYNRSLALKPGSAGHRPSFDRPTTSTVSPSEAEIKRHALAFNAILAAQNGESLSTLATFSDPEKEKESAARVANTLSQQWGINSREDLEDVLDRIMTGNSHRGKFWAARTALINARLDSLEQALASSSKFETERGLIVATRLAAPLGKVVPITAWDFGRYLNLCRWGYVVGWLSEKEAWDKILPVARMLQASYHSWDEFAADYLLGRNFWSPEVRSENNEIRYTIKMLERPYVGLWGVIPWSQSLGEGPVAVDSFSVKALADYREPDGNRPSPGYQSIHGREQMDSRTRADAKVGFRLPAPHANSEPGPDIPQTYEKKAIP